MIGKLGCISIAALVAIGVGALNMIPMLTTVGLAALAFCFGVYCGRNGLWEQG